MTHFFLILTLNFFPINFLTLNFFNTFFKSIFLELTFFGKFDLLYFFELKYGLDLLYKLNNTNTTCFLSKIFPAENLLRQKIKKLDKNFLAIFRHNLFVNKFDLFKNKTFLRIFCLKDFLGAKIYEKSFNAT